MPESPYYLIMKNKQESAAASLKSLKRYRNNELLQEDMDEMGKSVVNDLNDRGHFWDLFNNDGNRKALIISFGLQLILQFSGICAIESYTQEIMEDSGSGIDSGISVIILSLLQLIAGFGAAVLVDRVGRRILLLSTTFLGGVALTISGVFYFLKLYMAWDMTGLGWILDSSVIFYELIIALGLNPLAYLMLGELFPTNVKGIAVSLANVWGCLMAFFVSKMFQVITDTCGIYTSFVWFASSCFFGVVFIFFIVPETSGKSLFEIQEELNCGKPGKIHKVKEAREIYVNTIMA